MNFELINVIRAVVAGTWGEAKSDEWTACRHLSVRHGDQGIVSRGRQPFRIPNNALKRDLTLGNASQGGYLAKTEIVGYVPTLASPGSVLSLCSIVIPGESGALIPRGETSPTTYWLNGEVVPITESTPAFALISSTSKTVGAYCELSRKLLIASNADSVLKDELRRAATQALDTAILSGSGVSGEPMGLFATEGVGAFTGTSVNLAALRDAQGDVASSNGINSPGNLAYITTPDVAETLAARQRFTGSDRALWEGGIPVGEVEGHRAIATTSCPTASIAYGDWSNCWVLQWEGGLQIAVDPATKFQSGIVGVRIFMDVDVVFVRRPAFSIATSVT